MGFRFRRSVRVLPGVRLNMSRSGLSVSLGPRGLHYTVGQKGSRVTVGLPGTGVSWTKYTPYQQPIPAEPNIERADYAVSLSPRIQTSTSDADTVVIQSSSGSEINALSTSELAPLINSVLARKRTWPFVIGACVASISFALLSKSPTVAASAALLTAVALPLSRLLDAYSRSVHVDYRLDPASAAIADKIRRSFESLMNCSGLWAVTEKMASGDWKRNAGATNLQNRKRLSLTLGRPKCLRTEAVFPKMQGPGEELYFLPDAVIIFSRGSAAALSYKDFSLSAHDIRFVEEGTAPRDTVVLGHTWRYVNKNGGPDRRFNFNKELPICRYGEARLSSEGGLSCIIQSSNSSAMQGFSTAIEEIRSSDLNPIRSFSQIRIAEKWPSFAFLTLFRVSVLILGVASLYNLDDVLLRPGKPPAQVASEPPVIRMPAVRPDVPAPTIPAPRKVEPTRPINSNAQVPKPLPRAIEQPAPRTFAECLRIEDVDLRVDCLEQVHASSAVPRR